MQWYTVNTKPRRESQVERNLKKLGLETFCPLLRQRKVIRRKTQTVIGALFPGYMFVKCDIQNSYRAVCYARGVRRIVSFGLSPAPVDDEIIEGIKDRLTERELIVRPPTFTAGQSVRIHDGPLEGLEAIFEREMSGQQRVVLLLQAIAPHWRVIVPVEQVANL